MNDKDAKLIYDELKNKFNLDEFDYEALFYKQLGKSNVLAKSDSHSSHIAITGGQMDIFPWIDNYGHLVMKYSEFKKKYIMKISVVLSVNNLRYLRSKTMFKKDKLIKTFTHSNKSVRADGSKQVEVSYKKYEEKIFLENFREKIVINDYLIILKQKNKLNYLFLGIKEADMKIILGVMPSITNSVSKNDIYFEKTIAKSGKCVTQISEEDLILASDLSGRAYNRMLYGAPGTGKSYMLNEDLELYSDTQIERITFYSDYTYGKLVGMFKPTTGGKYTYQGGPFLRILCKALTDPDNPYFLIIEEINRTDAASVFGDVFQLLDRDENGQSVYKIDITEDMEEYFEENEPIKKFFVDDKIKIKDFVKNFRMYLPKNLYIWATMNSADQGVYPLDSAFKRRWSMEYIDIDNGYEKREGKEIKFTTYKSIKWNELRNKLNDFMDLKGIREDKQIGVFFLNDNELTQEGFINKLLMYLSEDVFRHQKRELFKKNTYGKIKKDFEAGEDIFISGSEELDALKSLFEKV